MNWTVFLNWVDDLGAEAALEKLVEIGFARSTAEKMVAGRYKSLPSNVNQRKLVRLTQIDGKTLFSEVTASGDRAS